MTKTTQNTSESPPQLTRKVDVKAIRDASPQAWHSFTVADQVNQLVAASEADPERGFMARTMALCSLPRSNPGNRKEYKRANGPFTLYMGSAHETEKIVR